MSYPKAIFLVIAVFSSIALGFLWVTEIPLGVPGEWVWERISYDSADALSLIPGGLLSLVVGGLYVFLVLRGARRIGNASSRMAAVWHSSLTIAGFAWLFAVGLCPPIPHGLAKSPWVLYYPTASGYFHEARYREESLPEYLANYESDIQTEDVSRRVLHHGTHPPGLIAAYRGLIRLSERSPRLVEIVLAAQPPGVTAMFDDIESHQRQEHALRDSDRAAIWLAALLTQLCGAAAVVPLFYLTRRIVPPPAAWVAVSLWPLVPALAVFLPKSDVLYAFLGTSFLAVWASGWKRISWIRCFLAGLIFWSGMLLSLAMLPVAFLAGVWTAWHWVFSKRDTEESPGIGQLLGSILAAAAGFLLPTLLTWFSTDLNLFAVWWQNYQNHGEFYEHFPRSFWPWFWVNPVETLFAVGPPLVVLAVFGIAEFWKSRKTTSASAQGLIVACLVTGILLWVSGKNRGEAARLWLVVFPCFVLVSAGCWKRLWDSADSRKMSRWLAAILVLQMLASWTTAIRVDGFPLPVPKSPANSENSRVWLKLDSPEKGGPADTKRYGGLPSSISAIPSAGVPLSPPQRLLGEAARICGSQTDR